MELSPEVTAELLPEPDNGTRLVVHSGGDDWKVIWRDDVEARRWGSPHETERWFDDASCDPMELHQHIKYARAVYRLSSPIMTIS